MIHKKLHGIFFIVAHISVWTLLCLNYAWPQDTLAPRTEITKEFETLEQWRAEWVERLYLTFLSRGHTGAFEVSFQTMIQEAVNRGIPQEVGEIVIALSQRFDNVDKRRFHQWLFELGTGYSMDQYQPEIAASGVSRPVSQRKMHRVSTLTANPCLDIVNNIKLLPNWRLQMFVGGKGLNVTRALHKWGIESFPFGIVGQKEGGLIKRLLEMDGIATRHLTEIKEATRTSLIFRIEREDRIAFTNGPALSSNETAELLNQLFDRETGVQPGDWLMISSGSMPSGLSEIAIQQVISMAKQRGIKTGLDSRGAPLRYGIEALPDFLGVNEAEFGELIIGGESGSFGEGIEERSGQIVRRARRLVHRGIKMIMVTMGEDGIVLVTSEGAWWAKPPKVEVHMAFGCGDVAKAGFIYRLIQDASLEEALQFATAASVTMATKWGIEVPTLEEVEGFFDKVMVVRLGSSGEKIGDALGQLEGEIVQGDLDQGAVGRML